MYPLGPESRNALRPHCVTPIRAAAKETNVAEDRALLVRGRVSGFKRIHEGRMTHTT